jgi:glycosyltransferase involved in cell wall biosynthesis
MNNPPLITVIIPTYNRINTVGNAIQSVQNQTYKNIEVIVVDDGSTDNTKKLIATFPQVIYLSKANGGQASARNEGLKIATGSFIASLDSDDIWKENFLKKMITYIEDNQLDFAFANWLQQDQYGNYFDFLSTYKHLPSYMLRNGNAWVNLDAKDLRVIYLAGCLSTSSSLLIRAESLVKRGWNENMKISDDWCMLLDIVINDPSNAAYTTEPLWEKNVNGDNIFDGRNKLEVLSLLVEDNLNLLNRYMPLLSPAEVKVLEKVYIVSLINVFRKILLTNKDVKKLLFYMLKAFSVQPIYTLSLCYGIIKKKILKQTVRKI